MYFGVIALQCLAASEMEKDDQNNANAYQIRLKSILNIENDYELQLLFKGNSIKPIQEELWYEAKRYLKEEYNLNLEIPERKEHAGRYVQYPKSQSLLNSEDLKYFTVFFLEEFQIKEFIDFFYFENRFNSRLSSLNLSKRTLILLADPLKRKLCIHQVFNYYCNWDGEVFDFDISRKTILKTQIGSPDKYHKLFLLFEQGLPVFYINDKMIAENHIFTLIEYFKFHRNKNMIIFKESEYYPNEYENSRFIYMDTPCYILIDMIKRSYELESLENNNIGKIEIGDTYVLFKLKLSDNLRRSFLAEYINEPHPIKLSGGIRLNRKFEYLQGYGPTIFSNYEYVIIFESKKYEYSPEKSSIGLYKIRVDNYPDVEFTIINKAEQLDCIKSKRKGWNLKCLCIDEKFDLEGLIINSDKRNNKSLIREWIQINLKSSFSKKFKYTSNNLLIKAIANSKI